MGNLLCAIHVSIITIIDVRCVRSFFTFRERKDHQEQTDWTALQVSGLVAAKLVFLVIFRLVLGFSLMNCVTQGSHRV